MPKRKTKERCHYEKQTHNVSPETAADETAVFSVGTAKDGNTVYFEIRANENTTPSKT